MKNKKLKIVECPNCGQQFEQKRSWQKFCKVKCRNEDYWKTHEVVTKIKEYV